MQHHRRQRVKNADYFPLAEPWNQYASESGSATIIFEISSTKKILCGVSRMRYKILITLDPVSLPLLSATNSTKADS